MFDMRSSSMIVLSKCRRHLNSLFDMVGGIENAEIGTYLKFSTTSRVGSVPENVETLSTIHSTTEKNAHAHVWL